MPLAVDLTGHRFSRLTAISALPGSRSSRRKWLCLCECGNKREVQTHHLINGEVKSCGCYKIEVATSNIVSANYKHGHKSDGYTREYTSWQAMLQRCTNRNHTFWKHYGGRGITVCAAWRHDFAAFLLDMGRRPAGKTLDRIDNDGNYEPSNCRWATVSQQIKNTRPRARNGLGQFK